MTASVKPQVGPEGYELAGWHPPDADAPSAGILEGYSVRGQATREELVLAGILGLALILLLVIVGMSLSQYLVLHSSVL